MGRVAIALKLLLPVVMIYSHSVCSQPHADEVARFGNDDNCTVITEPGTSDFDISSVQHEIPEGLIPPDSIIGNIVITRYPIFDHNDPKENYALYRLADHLHIDTKESTIQEQLIIASGENYEQRKLEESARILRRLPFLYDARIWPYRICGNRVDIEVVTREVWTITGGFSISRSGGSQDDSISITDRNFLGRGELVSITKTKSTDRDGIEFAYEDRSVAGSRYQMFLAYGDNDDGFVTTANVERPFYSLDTRYAWGGYINETRQNINLYEIGDEVATFQNHKHIGELHWGFSEGLKNAITKRWWIGVHGQNENYEPVPNEPAPTDFPQNRVVNYPWIGFDRINENFITTTNLNQIHRIEDYNLGASFSWRLGLAKESFGSDKDRLAYQGGYRNGWRFRDDILMQLELNLNGMWQLEEEQSEDSQINGSFRYFNSKSNYVGTYFAFDFAYAYDLPPYRQILLGAEEGLRGFPSRYQDGDRSFLMTIERRYYNDWHPFRLFRVGFAGFIDVGRAWFPKEARTEQTETLYNVGFGLRIASTRAQSDQVYHVDIGFPLNGPDDIDSYQITLTARQSF